MKAEREEEARRKYIEWMNKKVCMHVPVAQAMRYSASCGTIEYPIGITWLKCDIIHSKACLQISDHS